jgi:uncharacterized membrane protein YuzA (DUF378 family)
MTSKSCGANGKGEEFEESRLAFPSPIISMKLLVMISVILLIIGGLNWGLIGIANFDLVASLFGPGTTLTKIVYDLVGLAAIIKLIAWISKMSK